ncbi:hypothetical protein CPC08DRAFT_695810 [Agrocybe pediades]|nr:hypothetical protein CPC08DRAFT_695810 [Agrocybe pediades]
MEVYSFVPRYIQNNFPIRLIDVKTMRLLPSWEVISTVQALSHTIVKDNLETIANSIDGETALHQHLQNYKWYSILSHRWDSKEIIFQDILEFPKITTKAIDKLWKELASDSTFLDNRSALQELLRESQATEGVPAPKDGEEPLITQLYRLVQSLGPSPTYTNAGFAKLINFCYHTLTQYGIDLAWIDTCCIDKTSSAELEESIRSMFRWYRNSGVCLIYLGKTATLEGGVGMLRQDPWFSRGWTLQELLAPKHVKFYGKAWEPLTGNYQSNDKVFPPPGKGPAEERTLIELVSEITSISINELVNFKPGLDNVRGRLAWASRRETTRVEDEAYCLLGIFNITISIAYGEGENAFQRLQEAIIQKTNDRSLFIWEYDFLRGPEFYQSSILASRPKDFWNTTDEMTIELYTIPNHPEDLPPAHYTMTNHGLQIALSFCDDDYMRMWMKEMDIEYNSQVKYKLATLAFARKGEVLYPVLLLLTEHQERGYIYYKKHNNERTYRQPRITPYISIPVPPLDRPKLIYIR